MLTTIRRIPASKRPKEQLRHSGARHVLLVETLGALLFPTFAFSSMTNQAPCLGESNLNDRCILGSNTPASMPLQDALTGRPILPHPPPRPEPRGSAHDITPSSCINAKSQRAEYGAQSSQNLGSHSLGLGILQRLTHFVPGSR